MSKSKLRSLHYELKVEALINAGDKNSLDWPMLRIGGEVLQSNFLKQGMKVCFPLVHQPFYRRIHVDDRIKITVFCKPEDVKKELDEDNQGKVTVKETGAKYELWDDASEGWTCIYERWDKDSRTS